MICHKHLLADIISILGTTDFVLGSVDKAGEAKLIPERHIIIQ